MIYISVTTLRLLTCSNGCRNCELYVLMHGMRSFLLNNLKLERNIEFAEGDAPPTSLSRFSNHEIFSFEYKYGTDYEEVNISE